MNDKSMKQQICILGSTGSIGTQALDVIRQHPDRYEVYALTANNSVDKLVQQAREFHPAAVVIANERHYNELKSRLADLPDIKVYAGSDAIAQIVEAGPSRIPSMAVIPSTVSQRLFRRATRKPSMPSRLIRRFVWLTRKPL